MISRRIRHAHRYREVATILARNGFGLILEEMGLINLISFSRRILRKEEEVDTKTLGERLRNALEELGPTYVKIGQIASTRPDLIPDYLIRELEKLQDQVPPFSFAEVTQIIREELGAAPQEVFQHFEERPLAAASIGQVHYAVLKTGEKVAVKVQRPLISDTIETDLEILSDLAALAERRMDWAAFYHVRDMVEEFATSLRNELDYEIEGSNAERVGRQFVEDSSIYIPRVYKEYSKKRVLTLEYIQGVKLSQFQDLAELGYNRKVLAENLIKAMFKQILIEGFFHGDPHPGNIFVLPGQVIALIDFGMIGRLSPDMKDHFASLVIGMMRRKTEDMIEAVFAMGIVPEDIDRKILFRDVDLLREKYLDVPLSEVHLGNAVNDLFKVTFKHRIIIPTDLVLLGKSLLSLEGLVEQLDPEISIIDIAEPFGEQLFLERLNPGFIAEKTYRHVKEYLELMLELPKQARGIFNSIQRGKIRVEIYLPELATFIRKLDRISNQLSFSILLLSFSIMMTGLIIASALGNEPLVFWRISAIEAGFIVTGLMFLLLLVSILRSGRF
ncbi:putative unusual protein kinase [Desulfitobacterium dichloroeliminans LMG P-21439]|uniref:Putative unusual protein kinase n=1 Tax=Desulfitobacterium dichloroeliminans (strain LMG P-21439 / DCA1) TaxID=871963 RepID=L0F773_DESDL|nr:AarF/ABC1/UbiB kinase family protein [Desulfitobacterium dichloroeliminans]AGA69684.1 putative unusual protein kinase [Desulfitobacterium dichloroeliminans LMG P-21439]